MNAPDDLRAWLIALRTPGLGPGGLREALAAADGRIDGALARLRRHAGGLDERAAAWLDQPDEALLSADLAWLAEPGHRLLCCTEADFPPLLESIPQPPAALFVAGDAALLLHPQVAVVGARGASPVGLANARDFAAALAQAGFVVTSGMADGIDGAAHLAALDAGAPSIAVVGTGPDRVYPRNTSWPGASWRRARWSANSRPARRRGRTISRAATGSSPGWRWAPWWSRPACAPAR
jgi:DNA processing protein